MSVPTAPTSLLLTPQSGGVALEWFDTQVSVTYTAYRSEDGIAWRQVATSLSTAGSDPNSFVYTDDNAGRNDLINGKRYYYKVTAKNVSGQEGPPSPIASSVPFASTPSVVCIRSPAVVFQNLESQPFVLAPPLPGQAFNGGTIGLAGFGGDPRFNPFHILQPAAGDTSVSFTLADTRNAGTQVINITYGSTIQVSYTIVVPTWDFTKLTRCYLTLLDRQGRTDPAGKILIEQVDPGSTGAWNSRAITVVANASGEIIDASDALPGVLLATGILHRVSRDSLTWTDFTPAGLTFKLPAIIGRDVSSTVGWPA